MSFPSGPCSLKGDCSCPYGQLRPQYKCIACNRQLHHFYRGCSVQAVTDDNEQVLCKDGFGCQKNKKGKYNKSAKARIAAEAARVAAVQAIKEEKPLTISTVPLPNLEKTPPAAPVAVDIPSDNPDDNLPLIVPPKPRRQYVGLKGDTVSAPAFYNEHKRTVNQVETHPPLTDHRVYPKKRNVYPGGKKRGIRKGAKLQSNKTLEDWYYACQTYENLRKSTHPKLSHVDFLMGEHSGDLFHGTLSERQSFGRHLARYRKGTLQPLRVKRNKPRKYPDIEAKLISHLDLYANNPQWFAEDELSWKNLRKKCLVWAKEAGHDDFQVSPGWMDDTLKRHNRVIPGLKASRRGREIADDEDDVLDEDDLLGATAAELEDEGGLDVRAGVATSKRKLSLSNRAPLPTDTMPLQFSPELPTPMQTHMPFPQQYSFQLSQQQQQQQQQQPQGGGFNYVSQNQMQLPPSAMHTMQFPMSQQQGGFANYAPEQSQPQHQQALQQPMGFGNFGQEAPGMMSPQQTQPMGYPNFAPPATMMPPQNSGGAPTAQQIPDFPPQQQLPTNPQQLHLLQNLRHYGV